MIGAILINRNRQNTFVDMRAELFPNSRIAEYSDDNVPGGEMSQHLLISDTYKP